jgi:hypothetical protein
MRKLQALYCRGEAEVRLERRRGVVCVVTRLWGGGSGEPPDRPDLLCHPPPPRNHLFSGYRRYVPEVKRRGVRFDQSPSCSAEVKNEELHLCSICMPSWRG